MWERLPEADFIGVIAKPFTREMISKAHRARLIQAFSAGFDTIDATATFEAGIPLATTKGANAVSVAEHVFGMLINLHRRIPYAFAALRSGGWPQIEMYQGSVAELSGKSIGIIGLGNVGRAVARIARGFDMRVIYNDIVRPPVELELELQLTFLEKPELLKQSDIVSLHVPLTAETAALINHDTLTLLQPAAILVNASRGEVVDQAALVEFLQAGRITGAALDVFEQEPPDSNSPLLQMENVIVTPHMGGAAREAVERNFRWGYQNIQRVARGETARNLVTIDEL